jgi:hypothetical protein
MCETGNASARGIRLVPSSREKKRNDASHHAPGEGGVGAFRTGRTAAPKSRPSLAAARPPAEGRGRWFDFGMQET